MFEVTIVAGGPSPERGISLNSARSLADHLESADLSIARIVYFDKLERPYLISRAMLYSNTPDDFDFKLSRIAEPLSEAELADAFTASDLVFPAMHGAFGEDGTIQARLEALGVPFVGSSSSAAATAYDKGYCHDALGAAGIATVPSLVLEGGWPDPADGGAGAILDAAEVVVKPAAGGSSLDVSVLTGGRGRRSAIEAIVARNGRVVVQPKVAGAEFTVVVLDGPSGPVALAPVEVRITDGSAFLSYRHKYMASDDTQYDCPPRRPDPVIDGLRALAERTFRALGLRDFARIDCWLTDGGELLVSDVNPISGMEQNSFLFIQASQAGLTHGDVLRCVLRSACRRAGIEPPPTRSGLSAGVSRRRVPVLFGGSTAERQVSVLSGTNVWLKLLRSERYEPVPCLVEGTEHVWVLPYAAALRHSVEQIRDVCAGWEAAEPTRARIAAEVVERLALAPDQHTIAPTSPFRAELLDFLDGQDAVFIALHGGFGEDGTLQTELDRRGVAYNGSGPEASRVCADKILTAEALRGLEAEGIRVLDKSVVDLDELMAAGSDAQWEHLTAQLHADSLVGKPLGDGCSAGVVPLVSGAELGRYAQALADGDDKLTAEGFAALDADQIVSMPAAPVDRVFFEPYVFTDDIEIVPPDPSAPEGGARLAWGESRSTGWIEVTVGVLGPEGAVEALTPSLTVARQGVLSVEEKFMGGVGVNITPPPGPPLGHVQPGAVDAVRAAVSQAARMLGIRGYARIDAFMECSTGEVVVIEANSLPGLSPSTVLYHQALAEEPPMFPVDLLERLLDLGIAARDGEIAGRAV